MADDGFARRTIKLNNRKEIIMLIPVLIGIAVVVIAFIAIVAARPSEFHVSRSLAMAAPRDAVFPLVDTLRHWEAWNPWGKLDPNIKLTYDGPPSGVGASYAWSGNANVGAGRNTIVESSPGEWVRFRLEFFKPMKGVNAAEFTFKSQDGKTVVTWTMTGRNSFPAKIFGLFVNCGDMVGGQFEKGLAAMKDLAEVSQKEPVAA
jgi:hypothetical protein